MTMRIARFLRRCYNVPSMSSFRALAVLLLCGALVGPLLAPPAAPYLRSAQPAEGAPAHDEESGECPESSASQILAEDADAKHPAAAISVVPAAALIHREPGSSDEPRHREEKPLLPPPNKTASPI